MEAPNQQPHKLTVHVKSTIEEIEEVEDERQTPKVWVTPYSQGASKSDRVQWKLVNQSHESPVSKYKISFNYPEGTPLEWEAREAAANELIEGTVEEGEEDKESVYRYTVRVELESGTIVELDPEIRIRPPSR